MRRSADPHAYSWEISSAQMIDNRSDAPVPRCPPTPPDANASERQIEIVVDGDKPITAEAVAFGHAGHGTSGAVHEFLRLHEQYPVPVHRALAHVRMMCAS